VLSSALTKAGYSSRKTLKYMADKGLITSADRKDHKGKLYQITKRFDGRLCRFVEFKIGQLSEKVDPLDEDNDTPTPPAPKYEQRSFMDKDGFVPVGDGDVDLPFS